MKKSIIAVVLAMIMCFSPICVFADTTVDRAKVLYDLGLLKGTGTHFSEAGLELSRNATRAEVCTTIVRMLGKDQKAVYQHNSHPFNDVPMWASDYVGWLYENYLVNGVSDTYFGAQDIATVQQFSAMLLRVLGFDDRKGEFTYGTAVEFAKNYGLVTRDMTMRYELSRADMINMCYNALRANIKNSNRKLIKKLCDEGAVSEYSARSTGVMKEESISDSFPDVPENLGKISVQRQGSTYCITFDTAVEEYGLRVYVRESGGILKEISLDDIEKGKITYPGGRAAGYLRQLYVHGLSRSADYSFIVIKTTSEGELYQTTGKSGVAYN